jgi:hypothetical protein
MRDNWRWVPRDLWDVQGFIWATCSSKAEGDEVNDEVESKDRENKTDTKRPPLATSLIYYGPPGTGKTFITASKAAKLCDGHCPDEIDRIVGLELGADGSIVKPFSLSACPRLCRIALAGNGASCTNPCSGARRIQIMVL